MTDPLDRLLQGMRDQYGPSLASQDTNELDDELQALRQEQERMRMLEEQQNQVQMAEAQAKQLVGTPDTIYNPSTTGRASAMARIPGMHLAERGRGAQNSLLQGARSAFDAMPQLRGPMTNLGLTPESMTGDIEENRRKSQETQLLMDAVRREAGMSARYGDALTLGAEMIMFRKPYRHANPRKQKIGMAAKEGGIGGVFGLSTVGMSDEEKAAMIAGGVLTGAIAPEVLQRGFQAGGRVVTFSADRISHIKEMARLERLFDQTGILSLGELMQSNNLLKLESAFDNMPFIGLGKFRERQRARFRDMTISFFERLTGRPIGGRDSAKKASDELTDKLLTRFVNSKNINDKAYDDIARQMDSIPRGGQAEVPLVETQRAVTEVLEEQAKLLEGTKSPELVRRMESFLEGPTKPMVGGGDSITWESSRKTLTKIKSLAEDAKVRGALGEEGARDLRRSLVKIELALQADMREYARTVPSQNLRGQNLMAQLDDANEQFRRTVLPFYSSPGVSDAVAGLEFSVDDIAATFLQSSRTGKATLKRRPKADPQTPRERRTARSSLAPPELRPFNAERDLRVSTAFDDLEVDEQQLVKFIVMREALSRAQAGKGPGRLNLDPERFAAELGSMQKAWKVNLKPHEQDLIEGYVDLAKFADRAFNKPNSVGSMIALSGGIIGLNTLDEPDTAGGTAWLLSSIIGAKLILGTRFGTGLARRMANASDEAEKREIASLASGYITRYLAEKYPQFAPMFIEEIKEMGGLFGNSPYSGFNPMTDRQLQNNPPREDLTRR